MSCGGACGNQDCGGTCGIQRRMPAAVVADIPRVQKFASQNCKQYDDRLSECMLEEIELTQATPTVTGNLTPLTPIGAKTIFGLDTPAGMLWHFILFPQVPEAHRFCLREGSVTNAAGPVLPTLMGVSATKLFCSPDGRTVTAFNWAKTEKPIYTATTLWRCACNTLCIDQGVGVNELVAALFLLPAVGGPYAAQADGYRDCWGKAPGPCPPDKLCGRVGFQSFIVETGAFTWPAGLVGDPPPQQLVVPVARPHAVAAPAAAGPEQLVQMLVKALSQLVQPAAPEPAPAPPAKPKPKPDEK